MTRRVILRPQIPDGLRAIVAYLEAHSTSAADRFVEAAFAAMEDVTAMPGKGSLKKYRIARLAGVRTWSVPGFRKYLILYDTKPDAIVVLAVTHGARHIRKLLKERTG